MTTMMPPQCEVAAFTVFVFSGQLDLTAVPYCQNGAAVAIQTERPRPMMLCNECLHGYVHTLARLHLIPAVCAGCVDSSCTPPEKETEYTKPEWNRDPEKHETSPDEWEPPAPGGLPDWL
jgi:hypothetical protein